MITAGGRVRLHDLQDRAHLNAREGTCLEYKENTGRWIVRLDDTDEYALKATNLEPVVADGAAGASFLSAVEKLHPALLKLRAAIAAQDRWAACDALTETDAASVPVEPHIRLMLLRWLSEAGMQLPPVQPSGEGRQEESPTKPVIAQQSAAPQAVDAKVPKRKGPHKTLLRIHSGLASKNKMEVWRAMAAADAASVSIKPAIRWVLTMWLAGPPEERIAAKLSQDLECQRKSNTAWQGNPYDDPKKSPNASRMDNETRQAFPRGPTYHGEPAESCKENRFDMPANREEAASRCNEQSFAPRPTVAGIHVECSQDMVAQSAASGSHDSPAPPNIPAAQSSGMASSPKSSNASDLAATASQSTSAAISGTSVPRLFSNLQNVDLMASQPSPSTLTSGWPVIPVVPVAGVLPKAAARQPAESPPAGSFDWILRMSGHLRKQDAQMAAHPAAEARQNAMGLEPRNAMGLEPRSAAVVNAMGLEPKGSASQAVSQLPEKPTSSTSSELLRPTKGPEELWDGRAGIITSKPVIKTAPEGMVSKDKLEEMLAGLQAMLDMRSVDDASEKPVAEATIANQPITKDISLTSDPVQAPCGHPPNDIQPPLPPGMLFPSLKAMDNSPKRPRDEPVLAEPKQTQGNLPASASEDKPANTISKGVAIASSTGSDDKDMVEPERQEVLAGSDKCSETCAAESTKPLEAEVRQKEKKNEQFAEQPSEQTEPLESLSKRTKAKQHADALDTQTAPKDPSRKRKNVKQHAEWPEEQKQKKTSADKSSDASEKEAWEYLKTDSYGTGNFFDFNSF